MDSKFSSLLFPPLKKYKWIIACYKKLICDNTVRDKEQGVPKLLYSHSREGHLFYKADTLGNA